MATFISEHKDEFVGKSVLELGSGTGLSGILMSKVCGRPCVLTDGVDETLELLQKNIDLNGLTNSGRSESDSSFGVTTSKFLPKYIVKNCCGAPT